VNQMYIIQSPSAGELTLQGQRLTPAVHPITIVNGYNWIGFPLDTSMSVSEAFAGFNAVNNDKVTAQDGSTSTYRGTSWRNTFDLEPGQGYIFKSASFQTRTLTFPSLGKSVERKE